MPQYMYSLGPYNFMGAVLLIHTTWFPNNWEVVRKCFNVLKSSSFSKPKNKI